MALQQFYPMGVWKFLEFLQERLYQEHEVACKKEQEEEKAAAKDFGEFSHFSKIDELGGKMLHY